MIELVFVIVVIGILSSVAIPRFAATRDDAIIIKGKSQVAAIRSGIAMQKAQALLQGRNDGLYQNYKLKKLDNNDGRLFNFNDGNVSNVLQNPIYSKADGTGGWVENSENNYTFKMTNDVDIEFIYTPSSGIFGCSSDSDTENCKLLTQ